MSRSRRHNPYCSITCVGFDHGEKAHKRLAHRARRAAERSYGREFDLREVSNPWCWPKDGRQRFDPRAWPEGMRK